jgi:hypothetical protein
MLIGYVQQNILCYVMSNKEIFFVVDVSNVVSIGCQQKIFLLLRE